MRKIYNFSAGPSMIPRDVIVQAQVELQNWNKLNCSIMEISHRSEEFLQMASEMKQDLKSLLNIPDAYEVLFLQGGARGQFSAVPMNLLKRSRCADYVNSGYWSHCAAIEAEKYCTPNIIPIIKKNHSRISLLPVSQWNIRDNSEYVHYCPNETIHGITIYEEPSFHNKIIVGDFSSFILSRSINIKNYDLIYASAQKNIGPAGITVIIIRKSLIGHTSKVLPSILSYKTMLKHNSMFNTPPTFSWYLSGLVFKWLKKQGGIKKIEQLNQIKSDLLYTKIDSSDFYFNKISKNNRSQMNITFHLLQPELNNVFLTEAKNSGLIGLKGHYIAGGMRASIYNAMSLDGVRSLIDFMSYFENRYG